MDHPVDREVRGAPALGVPITTLQTTKIPGAGSYELSHWLRATRSRLWGWRGTEQLPGHALAPTPGVQYGPLPGFFYAGSLSEIL